MTKAKNTTPEYDDPAVEERSQEEILMNEQQLLAGLLDLDKTKDDAANYHKVQVKRGGVLKLEFRIRPVSEDENQLCGEQVTKYAKKTKPNQPKIALESDFALYRSYVIYTATVDEDRAKIWDNKQAQNALGIVHGVYMIDRVLLAGEKNRIFELIEKISGFTDEPDDPEETAKNSLKPGDTQL